jgi:hypothetical protein
VTEIQGEEFAISVAQDILGLTDANLGLADNPAAAQAERLRRFRRWVQAHTQPNPFANSDGKPVLIFDFTTSVANGGIFSNVIRQGYDRFWLHQNGEVRINLTTDQPANLAYRRVVISEDGVTHLRARDGCILDFRLIHPAALLGYPWPANQDPESVTADVKAAVNGNWATKERPLGGEPTPAFLWRPVSATEWQMVVFSGAPSGSFADLDLQQLSDIELYFSTTRASRTPGEPDPASCVRTDF